MNQAEKRKEEHPDGIHNFLAKLLTMESNSPASCYFGGRGGGGGGKRGHARVIDRPFDQRKSPGLRPLSKYANRLMGTTCVRLGGGKKRKKIVQGLTSLFRIPHEEREEKKKRKRGGGKGKGFRARSFRSASSKKEKRGKREYMRFKTVIRNAVALVIPTSAGKRRVGRGRGTSNGKVSEVGVCPRIDFHPWTEKKRKGERGERGGKGEKKKSLLLPPHTKKKNRGGGRKCDENAFLSLPFSFSLSLPKERKKAHKPSGKFPK